jgi:hypothetical protein
MKKKFILVTLIVFVLLTSVFYVLSAYAPGYHFIPLEGANALMAALTISSYFIVRRQMSGRPQAFVNGVMGASFLKLMVCMIAMLIYVLLNRASINKETIFMLFGIYIVYAVTETRLLSKLARE